MRILIVDDEPLARRGLRREIQRMPGLECAGECATRDEAVASIRRERPDLVLLDVQLGRQTGFDVIEAIGLEAMPLVIFVTAYDRHALRAFDVHAVDYVLKPVHPERLREALDRALRLLALSDDGALAGRLARLERLAAAQATLALPVPAAQLDRIAVPDGPRLGFVDVAAIDWVEAFGNYVRLHVGGRTHTLRSTLARMEQRVGPGQFIRVRRSALVNIAAIQSLEPYGKGVYAITLRGGGSLLSSRYHQGGLRGLVRPARA